MRDPRYDPYPDDFPILDPTHPDGPRGQVPLCTSTHGSVGCNHPTSWHTGPGTPAPGCDCCSWRQNDLDHVPPGPMPPLHAAPPGWSPEKWASMPRRERRAALRRGSKRPR